MNHPSNHPNFAAQYPLSAALGLKVVDAGPGFDSLELEDVLSPDRFAMLMNSVQQVFCCNHAKYPKGHEHAGYEVHGVYAADLEKYLESEDAT